MISDMVDAGFNESEIDDAVRTQLSQPTDKEMVQNAGKQIAGAAIVGGLSAGAGMLAPQTWGSGGVLGMQTAGAYGGELLRQGLMGEKFSQRKARESALLNLVPGLAAKGLAHGLGAGSGIQPIYTEEVAKRTRSPLDLFRKGRGYRLTFGAPPPDAELRLGERIGQTVDEQARPLTPGRVLEKQYIDAETRTGALIDPQPTIDALQEKMIKGAPALRVASSRNYNRRLQELIDTLEISKNSGGINPNELDEMLTSVLDPAMYGGGRTVGRNMVQRKGLPSARDAAKEQLLDALPSEARVARTQAAQELTRREAAADYFGSDKASGAMVNNIRNLFKPGHEKALETLRGIDPKYVDMAKEIATARAFTNDVRMKATILHRIMVTAGVAALASGRPLYGLAAIGTNPSTMRVGAKTIAPLQNIAGPLGAAAGGYARSRADNEPTKVAPGSEEGQHPIFKQTPVKPEDMFGALINAPAQEGQ